MLREIRRLGAGYIYKEEIRIGAIRMGLSIDNELAISRPERMIVSQLSRCSTGEWTPAPREHVHHIDFIGRRGLWLHHIGEAFSLIRPGWALFCDFLSIRQIHNLAALR